MKIYCNVCNKYRKSKKKKKLYIFKKAWVVLLFAVCMVMNITKIFKEKN